jgi:DNA polymerase III subunit chi
MRWPVRGRAHERRVTEIGFYHLTRSTPEQALPALLGRTLDTGARAVVRCASAEQVRALDAALWRSTDPVWLPHGASGGPSPGRQPIWLTAGDDVPNGATFAFLLSGVGDVAALDGFARVFDLFDGGEEAQVAAARTRWTAAKAAGFTLAYWQQQQRGWKRAR